MYRAFEGCNSLTSINISSNVTIIENDAFMNCTGINTVYFTDGGSSLMIGDKAFYGTNVKTVNLPSQLIYLGSEVFTNATCVNFARNSKLEVIYTDTFKGYYNLEEVVFTGSDAIIKNLAFANTDKLKSINLNISLFPAHNWNEIDQIVQNLHQP